MGISLKQLEMTAETWKTKISIFILTFVENAILFKNKEINFVYLSYEFQKSRIFSKIFNRML